MSFLYLASPYTDKSTAIMHERYLRVLEVTAHIQRAGITVYSPIIHNHEMAKRHKMPRDSEFWEKHNYAMLRVAAAMGILELPGWQDSVGIGKELRYARELNIVIRQIPYPLEELPKL